MYVSIFCKKKFVKEILCLFCYIETTNCLEKIIFSIQILSIEYLGKLCFPCRYMLITKMLNNEFNFLDVSYKIGKEWNGY